MSTNFWSYLAQFFLEWEMSETQVVVNFETHFVRSINIFLPSKKSCSLGDNVEEYCRTEQTTDDNMAHAHCMLNT
jgi:hypothetical protein